MKALRPDLFIAQQKVEFSQTPQTDAEAQVVRRTVIARAPAGFGGAGGPTNPNGSTLPALMEYTNNVGETADALKSSCQQCRHWDNKAWRKYVEASTGPASTARSRLTIDTLRLKIKTEERGYVDAQGQLDIEATLMSFGICHPLSDWTKGAMKAENPMHWPVAPMPESRCPSNIQVPGQGGPARLQIVTPSQPMGLFKPRDLDARKSGDAKRDALLFAVQGK